MSLTSKKFLLLNKALSKVSVPLSNLVFLVVLFGLPFLNHFKYESSVQEHGYLNRYSLNELVQADFDHMYKLKKYMLGETELESDMLGNLTSNHYNYYSQKNNYTDYQQYFRKAEADSSYSYWSDDRFEDTPDIYLKVAKILGRQKNIEVSFNKFKYCFPTTGNNSEIYGHNILFKLNCLRCFARGATLLVATVNTENVKEDISSVLLSIMTMKHLSKAKYLSQNIFLLVTMRQLPFSVGTRQFLHDYLNSQYFEHRSGNIHNALVVDLGTNNCVSFLISYEGIDGLLPNQDIVNIFVEISKLEGLQVNTRGLWQSIFRMAVNVDRTRQHVPLLEKNINAFSVICKSTSKVEQNSNFNLELLLKSLVLTVRNQNNLHTALERSFNFYYFVDPSSFVSISIYSLIIPLLFIRQIVWIVTSIFYQNYEMIFGLILVFLNIFLSSLPSYVYLLKLVRRNSGNELNSQVFNDLKMPLLFLILSYLFMFLLNCGLYTHFKAKFGHEQFQGHYLSKQELTSNFEKLTKTHKLNFLTKLRLKLANYRKRVLCWRFKDKGDDNDSNTNRSESSEMDMGTQRDPLLYDKLVELRVIGSSMGPYYHISMVPDRLPRVDLFLLFSTYLSSLSFLFGLSVLNWALCFTLSLVLLVPFNLVSLQKPSKIKASLSLLYFVFLTLLFYPFSGLLLPLRTKLFNLMRTGCDRLEDFLSKDQFENYEICTELSNKFGFLRSYVFGNRTNWINSKGDLFLLRRIYSATENHILFGSYNIVILLFLFGILAHMLFFNIVVLFFRENKAKTE